MAGKLQGRVALVTGAGQGAGRAIALTLAGERKTFSKAAGAVYLLYSPQQIT
jgi:NAD(P)-dependent dehydrogenase (short-subunit alcohol dehydrogenase family)